MNTKKELLNLFDPLYDSGVAPTGNASRSVAQPAMAQPLRVNLPPPGPTLGDAMPNTVANVAPAAAMVTGPNVMLPVNAMGQYVPVNYPFPQPAQPIYGIPQSAALPIVQSQHPGPYSANANNVHSLPAAMKSQSNAAFPPTNRFQPTGVSTVHSSGSLHTASSASNVRSVGATKWYGDVDSASASASKPSAEASSLTANSSSSVMQKAASSSNITRTVNETQSTSKTASASTAAASRTRAAEPAKKPPPQLGGYGLRGSVFDNDMSGGSSREERITLKMEERLRDYLVQRQLVVLCASWNVNGQIPSGDLINWLNPLLQERLTADQLRQLLEPASKKTDDKQPRPPSLSLCDVVVVAFQELDLSVGNALQVFDSAREPLWNAAVGAAINRLPSISSQNAIVDVTKSSQYEFERVKSLRLVGILVMVYVRKTLSPFVTDVYAESVPTGFMSMMGNKGAVAIRMRIGRTTVCFVGSHLCAHSEHYESRNQEFRDINARLRFNVLTDEKPPTAQQLAINDHNVVFWLGDLNYRLNQFTAEEAKNLVEQRAFKKLLENDQLGMAKRSSKAFVDYQEGEIEFAPTYKFNPGSDNWDSSEKCRVPAYCDRILWRVQSASANGKESAGTETVRLLKYTSHPSLKLSDHKPISALFALNIEEIDREKEHRVYQQVLKDIDKEENEMHPSAEVDKHDVVFDDVHYLDRLSRTVTLTNKSDRVPFNFSFTAPPRVKSEEEDEKASVAIGASAICQPWLSIKPTSGRVEPKQSCTLHFEVFINAHLARKMLASRCELQDLLILHLKGGCDIFLTVSGRFVPSCFGIGLHALVHMPMRVTEVPVNELFEFTSALPSEDRAGDSSSSATNSGFFEPFAPTNVDQLIDVSDNSYRSRAESVLLTNPALNDSPFPFSSSDSDQLPTSFRYGHRNTVDTSPLGPLTQSSQELDDPQEIKLQRIALDDALDKCKYQAGSFRTVACLQSGACVAPLSVPKELWLILNLLNSHALREPGLFSLPGLHDHHRVIAEYLDTGVVSSTPVSVHSIVEVLLQFLQALPDSVVPMVKYAQALHVASDADQSRALVSSLPRVNRFVFYYVTAFVSKCLEPSNAQHNLLDKMTAAQPLGDVLLRAPESLREDRLDPLVKRARIQKRATFVTHFL